MGERLRVNVKGRWYLVEVDDLSARPVRAVVDGHIIDVNVGSVNEKASPAPVPQAETPPTAAPPAEAPRATPPAPAPPNPPAPSPEPVAPPATPQDVVDRPPSATKTFVAPMPGTIFFDRGGCWRPGGHRRSGLRAGSDENAAGAQGQLVRRGQRGARCRRAAGVGRQPYPRARVAGSREELSGGYARPMSRGCTSAANGAS